MSLTICNAYNKALQSLRLEEQEQEMDKLLLRGVKFHSAEAQSKRFELYQKYNLKMDPSGMFSIPEELVVHLHNKGKSRFFFPADGLKDKQKEEMILFLEKEKIENSSQFSRYVIIKEMITFLQKTEIVYPF